MYSAFRGNDGTWGVGDDDSILYEPSFAKITAEAIADIENSDNPPTSWEEMAELLDKMGLPY